MSRPLDVAGCDPSTARTAIARVDGALVCLEPAPRTGQARLRYVHDGAVEAFAGAQVAVVEGYPFGIRDKGQRALAEVKGVLILAADACGALVVHVNPSTLKVYATGRGDADKAGMVAAAERAGGRPANHDEADAMWLRAMGRHRYGGRIPAGTRVDGLVDARLRALRAVRWAMPPAV